MKRGCLRVVSVESREGWVFSQIHPLLGIDFVETSPRRVRHIKKEQHPSRHKLNIFVTLTGSIIYCPLFALITD